MSYGNFPLLYNIYISDFSECFIIKLRTLFSLHMFCSIGFPLRSSAGYATTVANALISTAPSLPPRLAYTQVASARTCGTGTIEKMYEFE